MEQVASSTLNGAHSELQMGLSRLAAGKPVYPSHSPTFDSIGLEHGTVPHVC